jgi:formamidase
MAANLSDTEGDGEISFCGAIEMAGTITLKFDVIKGGMEKLGMTPQGLSPIYIPGPVQVSSDHILNTLGLRY